MKKILFLLFLMSCSASRTSTVFTEYNIGSYSSVIDSIKLSGTTVGPMKVWDFMLDDNTKDQVMISVLYKKDKATGSVQIRKVDSLYNVKIIDVK